jgi:hypothetical protein
MKNPDTKIRQLKERLELENSSSEDFIQFIYDVISCMPPQWQSAMSRSYLEGGSQLVDESTGKAVRTDSRYHIMNEHARYCFDSLVKIAREKPEVFRWLIEKA